MRKYYKSMVLMMVLMIALVVPVFAQEAVVAAKTSIWDIVLNNIELVSSGVIALLTMLFGGKMIIVKKKFTQLLELLNQIQKALKDGKVDKEELEEIVKDMKALLGKADKK